MALRLTFPLCRAWVRRTWRCRICCVCSVESSAAWSASWTRSSSCDADLAGGGAGQGTGRIQARSARTNRAGEVVRPRWRRALPAPIYRLTVRPPGSPRRSPRSEWSHNPSQPRRSAARSADDDVHKEVIAEREGAGRPRRLLRLWMARCVSGLHPDACLLDTPPCSSRRM